MSIIFTHQSEFRKVKRSKDFLARHPVFSHHHLAAFLQDSSGERSRNRLRAIVKAGKAVSILQNVYAAVPDGAQSEDVEPDRYLVASTFRPESILCGHSALELLGASHSVWNTCTAFSEAKPTNVSARSVTYRFLRHPSPLIKANKKEIGVRTYEASGNSILFTGPERTIVDGFHMPSIAGGVDELVASALGFAILDLDLLEEILVTYGKARLWAAVGWFLSTAQEQFYVDDIILRRFQDRIPASPQYLDRDLRGTFIRRWNLIVPNTLKGEERDEAEY